MNEPFDKGTLDGRGTFSDRQAKKRQFCATAPLEVISISNP